MNKVAKLRKQANMSQDHLAGASGVPKRTIQRIERGQVRAPRPETLRSIAHGLSAPVEQLTEWSVTRHALLELITIITVRAPSDEELASVPARFRATFEAHARIFREMSDHAAKMLKQRAHSERLHREWLEDCDRVSALRDSVASIDPSARATLLACRENMDRLLALAHTRNDESTQQWLEDWSRIEALTNEGTSNLVRLTRIICEYDLDTVQSKRLDAGGNGPLPAHAR